MTEPILSTKSYVLAYVGLLALLALNVGLAYINMGWVSMFVAVTIATMQAAILALVLMHGLFEKVLVRLIMAGALLWFMILMTLTMADYITRNWVPVAGK
jgi:cytochrome c oxidase subunit IV